MEFTEEQKQALRCGQAVSISMGDLNAVVIRKDLYERIRNLVCNDREWNDEEMVRLGWEAGVSIGWDTPEMAQYDDYDAHRTQS